MADQIQFLSEVRGHQMMIELEQDVHRSILFKRKGTFAYHFRLNTWPGHLSITGDMGDYVFSRTPDMFRFFRDPDMTNRINASYWHEKMRAQDKNSPARQFCEKKYRDAVKESADEWQVRLGDAKKIRDEIDDHLRWSEVGDTPSAYAAIRDFEASDGNRFEDFERCLEGYGHHFIWSLRAIVWGIKQYDLVKQGRTQADHDQRVLAGAL